ncbi:muts domain V-domain-containing protein [Yarrowia lipolytica]|uniref:Muts domain V-domain-containing protein n=1 Tax=Yarrowia lipolytica TaxID=4952 RepID=A0A371CEA3_YARLL|nr:DNA mismatch repair protein MSH1 [Yarrowia lipolytica]RDW28609.1 muts domain V-domain-containing protein [Yarrowia lipolytica]RDW35134.1 muts domain V-domain-containing protein [Yarrowia lipolytica]RDW37951.1 muts domain V-domain-containing protein [Yarrowia lipolytica]RDW46867.1 muts domain V-domain-containing protein [Yarrowia lipolytica]
MKRVSQKVLRQVNVLSRGIHVTRTSRQQPYTPHQAWPTSSEIVAFKTGKAARKKFQTTSETIELVELESTVLEDDNVTGLPPSKGLSEVSPSDVVSGVFSVMSQYPDSVVLTQVGSFYEFYGSHADKWGSELHLKVGKKTYNKGKLTSMTGFPLTQLAKYLKILVETYQQKVVICEQVETDDSSTSLMFSRPVTRIYTPGTLIDEDFLPTNRYNYLMSIWIAPESIRRPDETKDVAETPVGICWLDVSLGTCSVSRSSLGNLASDIARIKPQEIVMEKRMKELELENGEFYPELVELRSAPLSYSQPATSTTDFEFEPFFRVPKAYINDTLTQIDSHALKALAMALEYSKSHFPLGTLTFDPPNVELSTEHIMKIDSRSIEALELFKTMRDARTKGSLLSTLNGTKTDAGTRCLTEWLSAPLNHKQEIERRLDSVETFKTRNPLSLSLSAQMAQVKDILRIANMFAINRGKPYQLLEFADSCLLVNDMYHRLQTEHAKSALPESLLEQMERLKQVPMDLVETIYSTIERRDVDTSLSESSGSGEESESSEFSFGQLECEIRPEASPKMTKLCKTLDKLHNKKTQLQEDIVEEMTKLFPKFRSSRRKVELKVNVMGPVVSISGRPNNMPDQFMGCEVTKRKSLCSFVFPEWVKLAQNMDDVHVKIRQEAKSILDGLMENIKDKHQDIRAVGASLAYIDTVISLANLANEFNMVRPTTVESGPTEIVDGRHLTVQHSLRVGGTQFVSNTCRLDPEDQYVWVVSGPNMGGKSTFLRQNAIIVLLAQMGSFVPAKSAQIGLVDRLFVRAGVADDLFRNKSSFMVEMIETSVILRQAGPKSMVILDEVGRGTSFRDGIAVAYATLDYLYRFSKSRVLFATHFANEITNLFPDNYDTSGIAYYMSEVLEKEDYSSKNLLAVDPFQRTAHSLYSLTLEGVQFTRRIVPGISQDSHGIQIAQAAGFPKEAVESALEVVAKSK